MYGNCYVMSSRGSRRKAIRWQVKRKHSSACEKSAECCVTSSPGSHAQLLSNLFFSVTCISMGQKSSLASTSWVLHPGPGNRKCVMSSFMKPSWMLIRWVLCISPLRALQSVFLQQEISRHLRPNTLRALYGKDKVKNAVHCTDLPEDGVLEVGAVTDNTHTLPSACPSMWNTPTLFHLCSASDPQSLGPCINHLAFSWEQNPRLCEVVSLDESHDSALWAVATSAHTGFEENKHGRGIWNKTIVL